MAVVRKRQIGNRTYFYLEHSIKIDGRVEKKEKYLGKEIPKNIEKVKAEFLNSIYKQKWFRLLDRIKENFSKEYKRMPKLAIEKYIESFMIKFTYNTNRIEGSKLTLRETANLLEGGITPKNKPVKDVIEAESHKKVFYSMLGYKGDLNLGIVLKWHKMLFHDSEPEIAGRIRSHQIAVSGSDFEFPFPAELDYLLKEFFVWYNNSKNRLHPVESAALTHLKFVTIHPFTDGNGRTSRLMMNFVLNKHKFPMLNILYSNRNAYYKALERAQVKKLDNVFVQHILRRYVKEHKNYLK